MALVKKKAKVEKKATKKVAKKVTKPIAKKETKKVEVAIEKKVEQPKRRPTGLISQVRESDDEVSAKPMGRIMGWWIIRRQWQRILSPYDKRF